MKIIGGLFFAFGLLDMIGSYVGLDVWSDWIGVELPNAIWSFSAYIEMGIGYFVFSLGSKETASPMDGEPTDEEADG